MASEQILEDDIRCDCGRLLARRVSGGIEIKCRRCDRTVVIRLDGLPEDGSFIAPRSSR
jgi:phage FluMu protein Com